MIAKTNDIVTETECGKDGTERMTYLLKSFGDFQITSFDLPSNGIERTLTCVLSWLSVTLYLVKNGK